MLVFLDFEASSLRKNGYPIEVAWVFADGTHESHLIKPAPGWTDWDRNAQAVHNVPRELLDAEGTPHDIVANRMIDALTGHDIRATAPSWDGKWLSTLLRAAGLPRHALRLADSDDAHLDAARDILRAHVPAGELDHAARDVVAIVTFRRAEIVAHRALPDAMTCARVLCSLFGRLCAHVHNTALWRVLVCVGE